MLEISDNLRQKIRSGEYEPVLILEIDGLPACSSSAANEVLRFDDEDFNFDDMVFYDSSIRDKSVQVLIDIKKSSPSITQNLNQDTGGESSAQSFTVSLVDRRGIVTEWITPGAIIDDILGKKAKVYLNVKNGIHPEDSVMIMGGIVDGYTSESNRINATISSPEQYKRSDLFPKITTSIVSYPAFSTTLSGNVSAGVTDFPCTSVAGFPDPQNRIYNLPVQHFENAKRFYIQVGSDILSYSKIDGNNLVYEYEGESMPAHGAYTAGTTVTFYQVLPAAYTRGIDLVDVSQFIDPLIADFATLQCYLKIDEEIIQYEAIGLGGVSNITRGCLGTVAADHEYGATVDTIYRLQGSMKDLALKLMLSGTDEEYFYEGTANLVTDGSDTIANAIWFDDPRFFDSNVQVGDFVILSDTDTTTFKNRTIVSMGETETRKYVVVADVLGESLVAEEDVTVQIKSQYNTFPKYAGLGMTPDQVDIAEHVFIDETYFTQLLEFDILIKDTIKASELINKQLYLPNGCYAIPRKGQASIGITAPPIVDSDTNTLDETNIINASQIKIARSLNKNFFNAVTFQYEKDYVDDVYRRNNAYISATSTGRIRVPTKALSIKADGVRYDGNSDLLIYDTSKRILDRYQFGAESFEVQPKFSVGLFIEIGDSVIFDGRELNMSDTKNAVRGFRPRIMSVYNKTIKPWANKVTLTLIDTSFNINGRYGTLAPSSTIADDCTPSSIFLSVSDDTNLVSDNEASKWASYVGEYVAVRSDDWTTYEEKRILRIDDNQVILESDLGFTPTAGMILDAPVYPDNTDPTDHQRWKSRHCFFNPTVNIVSTSPSADRFTVDAADIDKFVVGGVVLLHNEDYSALSEEKLIESISVNTVIFATDFTFIPNATHVVELIGFKDGGMPYRWT